jgi:hypothetical protein
MSKPSFADGLKALKSQQPELIPSPAPPPKSVEPPSRAGKVIISAYFDPAVRQQLAIMAARQNKSQAALMAEALNMLFTEYGESQIARA